MAVIPTDFMQRGLIAARPAPGIAGRVWVVTDNGAQRATYDDGAAWQDIHVDPPFAPGGGGGGGDVTLLYHADLAVAGTFLYNPVDATFRSLEIRYSLHSDQGAGQIAYLQFNADAGNNYNWFGAHWDGGSGATLGNANDKGCILGTAPGTGGGTSASLTGKCEVPDYATADWNKLVLTNDTLWSVTPSTPMIEHFGSLWRNTAAITQIAVVPASGLFLAKSHLQIYGFK